MASAISAPERQDVKGAGNSDGRSTATCLASTRTFERSGNQELVAVAPVRRFELQAFPAEAAGAPPTALRE